jgi:hypothetical protein
MASTKSRCPPNDSAALSFTVNSQNRARRLYPATTPTSLVVDRTDSTQSELVRGAGRAVVCRNRIPFSLVQPGNTRRFFR